ncbi:hypothetical protein EVAR_62985_1 [Eumeta japonica]|uniref:Uncharacterized protein n=1 Tax=Eumeta variegata TaxID=151549 RepID=A0A4C1ZR90_EUMVA|nr:hypothetical protein EVAR_62985_1 [Eumeta japonica]
MLKYSRTYTRSMLVKPVDLQIPFSPTYVIFRPIVAKLYEILKQLMRLSVYEQVRGCKYIHLLNCDTPAAQGACVQKQRAVPLHACARVRDLRILH